jgi:hypothetical protein
MIDAAIAILTFALIASAIVFVVDALTELRSVRTINRRLKILTRSDF